MPSARRRPCASASARAPPRRAPPRARGWAGHRRDHGECRSRGGGENRSRELTSASSVTGSRSPGSTCSDPACTARPSSRAKRVATRELVDLGGRAATGPSPAGAAAGAGPRRGSAARARAFEAVAELPLDPSVAGSPRPPEREQRDAAVPETPRANASTAAPARRATGRRRPRRAAARAREHAKRAQRPRATACRRASPRGARPATAPSRAPVAAGAEPFQRLGASRARRSPRAAWRSWSRPPAALRRWRGARGPARSSAASQRWLPGAGLTPDSSARAPRGTASRNRSTLSSSSPWSPDLHRGGGRAYSGTRWGSGRPELGEVLAAAYAAIAARRA